MSDNAEVQPVPEVVKALCDLAVHRVRPISNAPRSHQSICQAFLSAQHDLELAAALLNAWLDAVNRVGSM